MNALAHHIGLLLDFVQNLPQQTLLFLTEMNALRAEQRRESENIKSRQDAHVDRAVHSSA